MKINSKYQKFKDIYPVFINENNNKRNKHE